MRTGMRAILGRIASSDPGRRGRRLFVGSTLLFQCSRFALGFAAAAFLVTADYAVWGQVQLLVAYSTYAQFGVGMGINRDLAFLLGAGRHVEGAQRSSASLLVTVVTTALFVVGGMLWLRPGPFLAAAFGIYIFLVSLTLYGQTVLRAAQRFDAVARGLLLQVGVIAALAVPFMAMARSLMFVLVLNGVMVVAFAYYLIVSRDLYTRTFSWPEVLAAVKSGLPLVAGAGAFTIRLTAPDLLTLSRFGTDFFAGLYVATIFVRTLYFIPTITNMLWLPELARSYSRSGRAAVRGATLRLSRTFVIWTATALLALVASSYAACQTALRSTCVDPGLVVARVASEGVTFLPVVLTMFLNVTRRMRVVIIANALGLLPYAVVALMSEPGKDALVVSMVLSAAIYTLVVVAGFRRSSSDPAPEASETVSALQDQASEEEARPA
jgi:hypothetical protein